jgi:hypothetical protein
MTKTTAMTETKLRRFIGVLLLAGDPADFSAAWYGVEVERSWSPAVVKKNRKTGSGCTDTRPAGEEDVV